MKSTIGAIFLLKASGLVMALVPEKPAELQTEDVDTNNTMSLVERQQPGSGRGKAVCGRYANADYHKARDLLFDLDNKLAGNDYKIKPGQCNRVHCYDTSAIYVCNVGSFTITNLKLLALHRW